MPSQPISSDPLISSFDGTEFFPLIQSADNKRALIGTLWTVNETSLAINTGSQAPSQTFNYRSSLWNGSSEVKGWASWRLDADVTTNLSQSLGLYFSSGASPSFASKVIKIDPTAALTKGIELMQHTSGFVRVTGLVGSPGLIFGANQTGLGLAVGGALDFYAATNRVGKWNVDSSLNFVDSGGGAFLKTTWNIGDIGRSGGNIIIGVNGITTGGAVCNTRNDLTVGGVQNMLFIDSGTGAQGGVAVRGGEYYFAGTALNVSDIQTRNPGVVTNTATQKTSFVYNYQTSLWSGSAQVQGWFSWRDDVSTSTNLLHTLALYQSTGSSPSFGGAPVFSVCSAGQVLIATSTNLGQTLQISGATLTGTLLWGTPTTPQGGLTFSGNDAYIDGKLSGGGLIFRTNGSTNRLVIDSAGVFTFGSATASQGMQLDTSAAGIVSLKFYTSALNYFSIIANSNTGENRIGGVSGGQFITFYVAGSQACRIDQFQLSFPTDNGFGIGGSAQRASVLYTYNVDMSGNLIFNTATGTKVGTANNQKLSLWGLAPDVQPTNAITAAAFVANTSGVVNDSATYGGYTGGQIVAALKRIGALA